MDFQHPNYIYYGKLVNIVNGRCIDVEIDLGFGATRPQRLRFAGVSDDPNPEDERWLGEIMSEMDTLIIRTVKDGQFLVSAHVWVVEQTGWASMSVVYVNATLSDAKERPVLIP